MGSPRQGRHFLQHIQFSIFFFYLVKHVTGHSYLHFHLSGICDVGSAAAVCRLVYRLVHGDRHGDRNADSNWSMLVSNVIEDSLICFAMATRDLGLAASLIGLTLFCRRMAISLRLIQ